MSRGVVRLAVILSLVHLLNFLNYTRLSGYFDPPLTRSVLLICSALFILIGSSRHIGEHFRHSWDMYGLCFLAVASAAFSLDSAHTLKYSMWLALSVYLGTELSLRVRTPRDVVGALAIVLLPASFLVGIANVTLGPVVLSTGRHFGALGSTHVDTAYAMNYICLFLAIRSVPDYANPMPQWLRWPMLALLAWSFYQSVFGLTRSVWLGVVLTVVLYLFKDKLSVRSLGMVVIAAGVAAILLSTFGANQILPDAVKGRVEVTEERIQSGEVDPRIEGIREALSTARAHPEGKGYGMDNSHNSYMNILVQLGWAGALLAIIAMTRSALMTWRKGFRWFMFYMIGSAALLLHAFFEVQSTPGQANFVPLLLWYALSRVSFAGTGSHPERPRFKFVEP